MTDTPDFDSMSPEEMMAWMETLAKRQGANMEELTTDADVDISEVSADDDRLKDAGEYVPHGWTKEKWEAHLAKEEEEKQAKLAAQQAQAPAPPPTPEPVAPPAPEPEPVASAGTGADETPDFDSMSPEEMMAWMESLAIRQGGNMEEMTTSADVQIAEVSADDERLKDKGEYVPHGWTKEKWEAHLAKEEEEKQAKLAAQQAAPPPTPEPVTPPAPDPLPSFDLAEEEETVPAIPVNDSPATDNPLEWLSSLGDNNDDSTDILAGLGELSTDSPLDSLASLATGDGGLGDLNFGDDLGADDGGDPMAWLAGLAGDEAADTAPAPATSADDADPIEWMESLSKRQGADSEELVTNADLDIPIPDNIINDAPGYGDDYSFENPPNDLPVPGDSEPLASLDANPMDMDDPESWLDSLASGVGQPDEPVAESNVDEGELMSILNQGGDVSPEQMHAFFEQQFDKAEQIPEPVVADDGATPADPNAPAVPADLPDWLQEQYAVVGDGDSTPTPPAEDQSDADAMLAALDLESIVDGDSQELDLGLDFDAIMAGDSNVIDDDSEDSGELEPAELPDWLTEDAGDEESDISSIFADPEPEPIEPAIPEPVADLEVDTSDPWVQALAIEGDAEGQKQMEAWYQQGLNNIDGGSPDVSQDVGLESAELPTETTLSEGQVEAVPDWLVDDTTESASITPEPSAVLAEEVPDWLSDNFDDDNTEEDMPDWLQDKPNTDVAVTSADLPDWLAEADVDIEPHEVPDWLRETMDEDQGIPTMITSDPETVVPPTPITSSTPITPVPVSPAPVPVAVAVANINVGETLGNARGKIESGDVDAAMVDYENIVRSNQSIDEVSADLQKLIADKAHKDNPAVYRILGDSLMRQGQLQVALETYRKALNLL